jgi:regulator of protease activity HflC (stomatin/prohibitin superfamily)
MRIKAVLLCCAAAFTLQGCGEVVQPGFQAKVLTPGGYTEEILGVGRHWPGWRGKLVFLETSTNTVTEDIPAKLSDGQDLTVDVRTRGRIEGSEDVLNAMFNTISLPDNDVLSYDQIYSIYMLPEIREGTRAAVSKFNAMEVPANYQALAASVTEEIKARTENLPIVLESVSVGKMDYPQVVKDAIDKASARQMQVAEALAQAEIDVTKAEAREKVAAAEYKAKIAEANAIADGNKIIAESLTPLLLEHRRLQVAESTMNNIRPDETDVVYMPFQTLSTPMNMGHITNP